MVLSWHGFAPRGYLACLEMFLVVTVGQRGGNLLLASREKRSGVPPQTPQCTGSLPSPSQAWSLPNTNSAELEKPRRRNTSSNILLPPVLLYNHTFPGVLKYNILEDNTQAVKELYIFHDVLLEQAVWSSTSNQFREAARSLHTGYISSPPRSAAALPAP